MNWKKVITLDNRFQADLLTDALDKEGIPFLLREYKDTAYDGLFIGQKGWATLMVDEASLETARGIVDDLFTKNPLFEVPLDESDCPGD
jgi:Putative prokaryotic signal transducing protein